jgi:SagB-type dehydrogenase family enzyme
MKIKKTSLAAAVLLCCAAASYAADAPKPVKLPKPETGGGKPLMQALQERKSTRSMDGRELPAQLLSNLLWAAAGVNRPGSGKRTVPSAKDWREVSVYAATPKGAYRYNAEANTLELLVPREIRPQAKLPPAALAAPVLLMYVADYAKMRDTKPDQQAFYAAADTGAIAQNVSLFCASEGLATVVMGGIDKALLSKELGLHPWQKVILVQPVGYPGAEEKPAAPAGGK